MSDQLVITVSGPTGSGKSTLAEEIVRALAERYNTRIYPQVDSQPQVDRTVGLLRAADEDAPVYIGTRVGANGADSVYLKIASESYDEWRHRTGRSNLTTHPIVRPGETVVVTPDVGPLASTEGLQPGDVVRVLAKLDEGPAEGSVVRVASAIGGFVCPEGFERMEADGLPNVGWDVHAFAFVGRPDAEGWIPWAGGECPLSDDTMIEARMRSGWSVCDKPIKAKEPRWDHEDAFDDLTAFRIVGLTDTPRQGDPVEPPFSVQPRSPLEDFDIKGYDLSRTPKDIMERAFAIIHDAGPDCRIKGLAIMPPPGLLRVEAWPEGSDGPLNTYVETVEQMRAYYRSIWATDGRWTPNPAPADAKATISPEVVQEGDKVRVVIEGPVNEGNGNWDGLTRHFVQKVTEKFRNTTIELLERPEQPLAVGDLVRWDKAPGKTGEIRSIDTETNEAWVRWKTWDRDYSTVSRSDLTRA